MIFYLNKEIPLPKGKSLIVFDTDCLLCNRAMNALLFLERNDCFMIASRTSISLSTFLASHDTLTREDSVILISGALAYTKADAAKRIALKLNYIITPIAAIIWVIPNPILNLIYSWIARNRGTRTPTANCSVLNKEKYHHKIYS